MCLVCSQSQQCADGGWSSSHLSPALLLCLPLAERHSFSPSASLHPSLPPMPKLAFIIDGFSKDDYGLETRERKTPLHPPGRRSIHAQRHCAHPFSLRCFSVWHSPPQSETATRARECRSSVRLPSSPPPSLSISPPSRSSSTQLAGCSSKNLPANKRGEERNGKQRVKKNTGTRRDREERRQRLVNGEKKRGQKDWESRKEEPEGRGEERSLEARRKG